MTRVILFEALVTICESMRERSRAASISNERMFYAREFFRKGTEHGRSMCRLIEPLKRKERADVAGICVLARALIETHNAFLYLTESKLSAELDFRIALLQLNGAVDLHRINNALGIGSDDVRMWAQEVSKKFAIDELNANQVFLALEQKQRDHLLRGKYPYLMHRYAGPRPIERAIESAAYNLFSHSVHSFGLSSSFAGRATPAGYVNLLILALQMSAIFLAHLAKRYRSLRGRAIGAMVATDKQLIEDVLSLKRFNEWKWDLGRLDAGL